jgi:hypothetical protein
VTAGTCVHVMPSALASMTPFSPTATHVPSPHATPWRESLTPLVTVPQAEPSSVRRMAPPSPTPTNMPGRKPSPFRFADEEPPGVQWRPSLPTTVLPPVPAAIHVPAPWATSRKSVLHA